MRTTLTLDEDVLDRARLLAKSLHTPFRKVVNEALRAGLEEISKPAAQRPYQTKPHRMELREGYDLDNIQEVLAVAEGEDFK
jgi:hypothetical protein